MPQVIPWVKNIGHLAIIIHDIELGKWFFGEVLQVSFFMYKDQQIMVELDLKGNKSHVFTSQ